ncbi:MAG: DUF6600 domain-containing protein [Blastocatellia bacterium]
MKRALTLLLTLAFSLALTPNHSITFGQTPSPPDPLLEDVDDDPEVSRVARLSFVAGEVSFLRAGVSEWAAAIENLPLLAGDQIYTASGARAEIQLARGSYIRLAENTALTIADLSDSQSQFEVTSGTAIIRVERFASAFQRFEVDTPNSALVLKEDGLYRIDVRSDDESEVIVRNGAAEVSTSDSSFSVKEGQRLSLDTGAQGRIEIAADDTRDDWDRWSYDRDSTIHQASTAVSPDYVSAYETTYNNFYGVSDLSNYGTWTDVSSYGQCWIPRVGSDWAPYRTGQWLWIPRAGWTWLSREPWGWAPYHYGRWVFAQGFGWMWVPGFTRYPDPSRFRNYCWRPALVTFFNYPTSRGNYVGWYPLAPGERWRRHDRQLRGGDHSHLQYPAVRNGSERPDDGRVGIRPPARGVTVVPVEGFNRSDRSRTRPSAPTPELSDWIRRGARAGLPEIAKTPATTAPAIDPADRRSPRRVAVPPGEIIGRPVVTRNRTTTPASEGQPRERRLISPRRPEFVIDVPTGKQRSAEERQTDRKVKQPAAASGEQASPEVRSLPKPRTSVAPPASENTPRNQREKDSGRREWKPPSSEPTPSQDAKPRRGPEEPGRKEVQPRPYVENKEQNRPQVRERKEPQRPPESKETRRPPEPREMQRPPVAKETPRPAEPKATQPRTEPRQTQAQPKEERREERSERKKP